MMYELKAYAWATFAAAGIARGKDVGAASRHADQLVDQLESRVKNWQDEEEQRRMERAGRIGRIARPGDTPPPPPRPDPSTDPGSR